MSQFYKTRYGGAVANADVQSQNIVGFQEVEVPVGYSMFTVTFEDVAGGEYDLTNIELLNYASEPMDNTRTTPNRQSNGVVKFQKINTSTGTMLSTNYMFTSAQHAWMASGKKVVAGNVTFKSGEGFYLNNAQKEIDGTLVPVKLRFSGQVTITPMSMELKPGYSIVGNMTPVPVDISKIKLLNYAGEEMDNTRTTPNRQSNGVVKFQKINTTTGTMLAANYMFTSAQHAWMTGGKKLTEGVEFLQPGECVYINNGQKEIDGTAVSVYLEFPSPIKD